MLTSLQSSCLEQIVVIFRPRLGGVFVRKAGPRFVKPTSLVDMRKLLCNIVMEPKSEFVRNPFVHDDHEWKVTGSA